MFLLCLLLTGYFCQIHFVCVSISKKKIIQNKTTQLDCIWGLHMFCVHWFIVLSILSTELWTKLTWSLCTSTGPAGPQGLRGPPGPPGSNSQQPHSAFSVTLGGTIPSSSIVLRFSRVTYNGQNHYSTSTGKFTCHVPGVYQFEVFCTAFRSVGSVQLKRNRVVVMTTFSSYTDNRINYTGDTVVQLGLGDEVWLEASQGGSGLLSESFFTGHILFTV